MGQKKHKYKVNLTPAERSELGRLTLGGHHRRAETESGENLDAGR